ncbi:hypothetical protein LTS18_010736, partial [Coniosporium uncinatum]
ICYKKREAEALAAPEPAAAAEAAAAAAPEAFRRFCHLPGQICYKAKRALEDLESAAAQTQEIDEEE